MALKFEEVQTPYPARSLDDLKHKARLFEMLRLASKREFQWLQPLLCLREPNPLLHGLTWLYAIGGSRKFEHTLTGNAFNLLNEWVSDLKEKGGHPLDERTAFIFLRLALGAYYEDVLDDEKKLEVTLEADEDRKRATERAKARVRTAKKHITKLGLNVRHIDPRIKKFRQQISLAAKKLESREGESRATGFGGELQ